MNGCCSKCDEGSPCSGPVAGPQDVGPTDGNDSAAVADGFAWAMLEASRLEAASVFWIAAHAYDVYRRAAVRPASDLSEFVRGLLRSQVERVSAHPELAAELPSFRRRMSFDSESPATLIPLGDDTERWPADPLPEEESDLPVEDRAQGSDSGSNADALTSPRAAARALVARVERPICRVPRPERTDTPGRKCCIDYFHYVADPSIIRAKNRHGTSKEGIRRVIVRWDFWAKAKFHDEQTGAASGENDDRVCDCACCLFFQFVLPDLPGERWSKAYEDCADVWPGPDGEVATANVGAVAEGTHKGALPSPDARRACYGTREGFDPRDVGVESNYWTDERKSDSTEEERAQARASGCYFEMHDWPGRRSDPGTSISRWRFFGQIRDKCRNLMLVLPKGEAQFRATLSLSLGSAADALSTGTLEAFGTRMGSQPKEEWIPVTNASGRD